MPNFFEKLGKKVTDVGQSAMDKTKNSAEILRLGNLLNDEQRLCNTLHQKIGKAYVEQHQTEATALFPTEMEQISASQQRIQAYQLQLRKLKHITVCEKCGKEIPETAVFCDACGTRTNMGMQPPVTKAATQQLICSTCYAPLFPESRFCTKCGSPVVTETPPVQLAGVVAVPPLPETPDIPTKSEDTIKLDISQILEETDQQSAEAAAGCPSSEENSPEIAEDKESVEA